MNRLGFGFLFLALTATLAHAGSWTLNDVSVLSPLSGDLPATKNFLPRAVYQLHPVGYINFQGVDETYDRLRVVGVRIDPEQKQLRLVSQPVEIDPGTHRLTTEDEAAHTFYQFQPARFAELLQEWMQLKSEFPGQTGPLGVHRAGNNPRFRAALAGILKKYCTRDALIQYTAMKLMSPDHSWWSFAGVKRSGASGAWVKIKIPGLKNPSVDFFNFSDETNPKTGDFIGMRGQLNFAHDHPLPLSKAVEFYSPPEESDRPLLTFGMGQIAKLQNPHLTNPDKVDCASCHIAQPLRFWISRYFKDLQVPAGQESNWFQNPDPKRFDLRNRTVQSTRVLRAFGYIGDRPAVNQRVIHESALVADYLNRHPL